MQCTKLLINGHVQGVCFRQTAKTIADHMKIEGTVKNLSTGDVELVLATSKDEAKNFLEKIVDALPAGEVNSYTVSQIEVEKQISGFHILY